MSKSHGAKQQKKLAKQKAKRAARRSELSARSSSDPTVRLQNAAKWPVVAALVPEGLWIEGIGQLVIAREQSDGNVVIGVYLVDVYCLGVKNAFWTAGTPGDFRRLIERIEERETLRPVTPECLAKIVRGAVDYAQSYGFAPHRDFRHAALLLEGIDPDACPQEFTYGRDGKPFYIRGPYETLEAARVISERIVEAGGDYIIPIPGPTTFGQLADVEDEEDDPDE